MASKTTTFVVRIDNAAGFSARATDSMGYTHALVVRFEDGEHALSWHTSAALAKKAADSYKGGSPKRVVAVEAHEGTKATIVKRLTAAAKPAAKPAAEKPAATAPAKSSPAAVKAAAVIDGMKGRNAATWTVSGPDATHKCAGACGETKPLRAFPTTKKTGQRGVECRTCRDARTKK